MQRDAPRAAWIRELRSRQNERKAFGYRPFFISQRGLSGQK